VDSGSHRVAAAKLAEAMVIPAEVADLTDRKEFSTTEEATSLWWETLIKAGVIKGEINDRRSERVLILESTPNLPWIVRPPYHFVRVNRAYREVYGDEALAGFTLIPQKALFDQGEITIWENKALQE